MSKKKDEPRGYFSDDLIGDMIIMSYLNTANIDKLERIRFNINKIIKRKKYGLYGVKPKKG